MAQKCRAIASKQAARRFRIVRARCRLAVSPLLCRHGGGTVSAGGVIPGKPKVLTWRAPQPASGRRVVPFVVETVPSRLAEERDRWVRPPRPRRGVTRRPGPSTPRAKRRLAAPPLTANAVRAASGESRPRIPLVQRNPSAVMAHIAGERPTNQRRQANAPGRADTSNMTPVRAPRSTQPAAESESTGSSSSSADGSPNVSSELQDSAHCESSGSAWTLSPDGQYRGKWELDRSTWEALGCSGDLVDASEAKQDRLAGQLCTQSGSSSEPTAGVGSRLRNYG